ncbi:MAG: DUF58 domain-containing protein [Cardiobacteriaceae bacterium]|nr:DUF58 domain-containing protein [Cardiobacteriaceae bacterium]
MLIPHRNLIAIWFAALLVIIPLCMQAKNAALWSEDAIISWIILAIMLIFTLITALLAKKRKPQITVKRTVGEIQQSGEIFTVELELQNHTNRELSAEIFDHLPSEADCSQMPIAAKIPSKGKIKISYETKIQARGRFSFADVQIRIPDTAYLWLFDLKIKTEEPNNLRLYPKFKYTDNQVLQGIVAHRPTDIHPLHFQRGNGDFAYIRDYAAGDPLNHIDHKASARAGKWCVREFEHTYGQPVLLMIDASRRTAVKHREKVLFDEIITAANQLAKTALHKGDEVGLQIFSSEIKRFLPPSRNSHQYKHWTESLFDCFADNSPPDFQLALKTAFCRQKERSLIIFITTPQYGDAENLQKLFRLIGKKHHLLFVAIRPSFLDERTEIYQTDDNFANAARDTYHFKFKQICQKLKQEKILFLETKPEQLRTKLINAYLEYKARIISH